MDFSIADEDVYLYTWRFEFDSVDDVNKAFNSIKEETRAKIVIEDNNKDTYSIYFEIYDMNFKHMKKQIGKNHNSCKVIENPDLYEDDYFTKIIFFCKVDRYIDNLFKDYENSKNKIIINC